MTFVVLGARANRDPTQYVMAALRCLYAMQVLGVSLEIPGRIS